MPLGQNEAVKSVLFFKFIFNRVVALTQFIDCKFLIVHCHCWRVGEINFCQPTKRKREWDGRLCTFSQLFKAFTLKRQMNCIRSIEHTQSRFIPNRACEKAVRVQFEKSSSNFCFGGSYWNSILTIHQMRFSDAIRFGLRTWLRVLGNNGAVYRYI